MTRSDGVNLYRFAVPNTKHINDKGEEVWDKPQFKIRQDQTGTLYDEAIDVENKGYTYTETGIPVESDIDPQLETDLTVNDTLEILNNTNNNQVNNEDTFNSLLWNGNNIEYKINDKVIYNNSIYNVIKNHTSKPDWKPDNTIGLFKLIK